MSTTADSNWQAPSDPQFREAMSAVQTGQWQQAMPLLEELTRQHPDDTRVARMLADARFKSNMESHMRVRERRWIIPWRAITLRLLMFGAVAALLLLGWTLIQVRVLPMLSNVQEERRELQLLTSGEQALAQGDFDAAAGHFERLLELVPDHPEALAGLATIATQRDLLERYNAALAAEKSGDEATALAVYNDLQIAAPGYRDVSVRINSLRKRQELAKLYEQAGTLQKLGLEPEAMTALRQIQELDINYRRSEVSQQLFNLNFKQGQRILNQQPPVPARAAEALDAFNAALALQPNDPQALTEARLLVNFMRGRDAYNAENWREAVNRLRTVYTERPRYFGDATVAMLYIALVRLGEETMGDDIIFAYDQFSQACQLPLPDTVAACARSSDLIVLMTPTPTPTMTLTPAPTPTPGPPPSATPTPTPRPLSVFRNKIVFKADNPDQPGFYAMDPDGSNRVFLGPFDYYEDAFAAYRETERYSPDGRYWVSTADVYGKAQIILHLPGDVDWKPVTLMTRMSYDPVWSPDGEWIAFVSTENESDDIWRSRPDASQQEALMRNEWEWDKHPTYSPDSQRIAFFSNREGYTQIFVMDANGRYPKNISRQPWPEYDPIWIK